jgi:DNA-directed RNA polymerase subunit D
MVVEQKAVREAEEYRTMKAKEISKSKKDGKLVFEIKDVDGSFVNAMRRLVIEEVPTLAVEFCEFRDNSSALYDEMMALRLGFTPIKTDLSSYRLPENDLEVEERSARCTLQLHLKANKKGLVLAGEAQSKDPKCTFVYPGMPIVKLVGKQKVDVILTAVMGQGKDHIKWAPGHMWFSQNAELKIDNKKEMSDEIKKRYPPQIFEKGKISEDKIRKNNLIDAIDGISDFITVNYVDKDYTVKVESWGQLTCKEMLSTGAEMLIKKVDELEAQL